MPTPRLLAAVLLLGLGAIPARGAAAQSSGPDITLTSSFADVLTFAPPTLVGRRTDVFLTEILARLGTSAPVYDAVVAAPYGSAAANAALAAAVNALTLAGGPGLSITGPTLTAHTETLLSSTTTSLFTLGSATAQPPVTTTTIGPAVITVGEINFCAPAVAALPSATAPVCLVAPQSFTVLAGTENIDARSSTVYVVDETRTTTSTYRVGEVYTLLGTAATTVPEPGTVALLGAGLAGLAGLRARRRART